jgi:hypothetical protein
VAQTSRDRWEKIGREALLDLLEERFVVPWAEAEAHISNTGWKDFERVQPVQLSGARRSLRAEEKIVEEVSKQRPPVHMVRLPYPEQGRRDLERLVGRRRKAYRKYLSWTNDQRLCGKHAEKVVYASAREAATEAGLVVPRQTVGEVSEVGGVDVTRGPLDGYAHLLELPDIRSEVVMVIEVKNINTWIYPNRRELWELLVKAADLAEHMLVLPVIVCMRAAWQTTQMAKDIGFLACQMIEQVFSPSIPEEEFRGVVDDFGLTARRMEGAHDGVVSFLTRVPRMNPPPSEPRTDELFYRRQAERFRALREIVAAHDALGTALGDTARRREFAAF